MCTFSLAVNRRNEKDKADFFNIVAWSKTGEFCSKYFKKGQQVGIIGRLQTRSYEDKDGKTTNVTEVIAEETYFADSKQTPEQVTTDQINETGSTFDDLPF